MLEHVFNETCKRYEAILQNYYPSHGSVGFTERNLTFNFCSSFLKEAKNDDLIIWQEVPIKKSEVGDLSEIAKKRSRRLFSYKRQRKKFVSDRGEKTKCFK